MGSPRCTTGTPRPCTPTATRCCQSPKPPRWCRTPFSSRSRGWTGSVILTGSMPGCMPSHATSACAASGPAGVATAAALVSRSADPGELPAVTLPTELRGQVLTACADNSPTGRAHRVSVTHRAGAFGPSGFPKAIGPAWPRWWRRVQRHPGLMAAVAVMAAVATAAGITVIMTASGSQRTQASALGLGGGVSGAPSSATPGRVSATPSPTRKTTPAASPATPSVTMRADAPSPVPPSVTMTKEPSASPSQSSAAPSPSPSPSTSPRQPRATCWPGEPS